MVADLAARTADFFAAGRGIAQAAREINTRLWPRGWRGTCLISGRKERSTKHLLTALTLAGATALALPALAQSPAGETTPLFAEPRFIAKPMSWVADFAPDEGKASKDGFYPELGHMITGAGWIAAGPGYRRHVLRGNALVDLSAGLSWRAYKIAQGRLEFPYLANNRVVVGSKLLWQDFTQVRYFGRGPETLETDVSDYRLRTTNVVGYATWQPRSSVRISGSVGWLSRPRLSWSGGSFDRSDPDTLAVHGAEPGGGLVYQPRYVHVQLSVAADTRDYPSYRTRGTLLRGEWSTYRDQPTGSFTFDRSEGEAACFLPIAGHGVVAAHFWGVFTGTREGRDVPFYLLPSLGGHNTLRGYADYRFHDRHLVLATLESRWALFEHVDTAVFFEAGNVAARAADLNFARTSYGAGVRLHTRTTTLARFDAGRSAEGWRFMLRLTDALRLARLTKRTAAIPFVP